jgi:multiple sugar transport system substrate-binding protein
MDELSRLTQLYREGKVTRRKFLQLSAMIAAGVAASSCAPAATPTPTPRPTAVPSTKVPPTAVPPPPAFDWKKYAGTKITALFTQNQQGNHLQTRVADFVSATGIDVDFQIIDTGAMRDMQAVQFAAGASDIDVWHTFPPQEGLKYSRAGWYEPIQPYLDNPALVAPDYDPADFGNFGYAVIQGELVGIPMWIEFNPLYYNKEILEQAGVGVPQTMDEMEEAAKKIHSPAKEIYGFATRGSSYLNTSPMTSVFFSMGGEWLTPDGKASLNSPEAIAALDWYGRMLRLYGPPSPETLDYARASDLFANGKVAFHTDSPSFIGTFIDPTKSKVVGKFDVVKWPAGPAGSVSYIGGWAACIGKFSKNKEAAWYYVMWNTSKEASFLMSKVAGMPSSRQSVAQLPEYKEFWNQKVPGLLAVAEHALKTGRPDMYPPVEVAAEGRQLWGDAIVEVILGRDAKAAAETANQKFQALLDRES